MPKHRLLLGLNFQIRLFVLTIILIQVSSQIQNGMRNQGTFRIRPGVARGIHRLGAELGLPRSGQRALQAARNNRALNPRPGLRQVGAI